MDPIVAGFIHTYIYPDLAESVYRALNICKDVYENYDEVGFIELISNEQNMHTEDLLDSFVNLVNKKLDFIIHSHHFDLTDDTKLHDKNEFVSALVALQDCNDYSEILPTLESDMEDDEKIAEILSTFTHLSSEYLTSMIIAFDNNFINMVKVMVTDKTNDLSKPANIDKQFIKQFKLLKKYLNGKSCLAFKLIDAGFPPNLEFEQYHVFVKDNLELNNQTDLTQYSINLFSLIMLSKNGVVNPIQVFRDNSRSLTDDLSIITKLDSAILKFSSEFKTYADSAS